MELSDFVEKEYRRYAEYTLNDKGFPDVYDGLAHAQRRLLLAAIGLGLHKDDTTTKSARLTGETTGRYHPHGDTSAYGTLVGLAATDSNNYPIFITQGDFGSTSDPDSFAAPRYTEVGISDFARDLFFFDYSKYPIEYVSNYDDTLQLPVVLPTAIPVCFLRRTKFLAIAVSLTSQFPAFNLGELIDCYLDYLENDIPMELAVRTHIVGPDYAWGGEVFLSKNALESGEAKQFHLYPRVASTGNSFVVSEIPIQDFSASIDRVREKLEAKGLLPSIYIEDDETVSCSVPRGTENSDTIIGILRSEFSLTNGGLYTTFIVDGVAENLSLAEALELHIDYTVSLVGKDTLIQKLKGLEKYVVPRRTALLSTPYKLHRVEAAEEAITVYLTQSGILKTVDSGFWTSKGWDTTVCVVKTTNLQSVVFIAEDGVVRTTQLAKVIAKAAGKNGVHLSDLGYKGVILPNTNPVLVYDKKLARGRAIRNTPFQKTVYPSGNKTFLAVCRNGQYYLSALPKFKVDLDDEVIYSGFVGDAFKLVITGRASGRRMQVKPSLLTYDRVSTLMFSEQISAVEVI